jgi:TRAP-type mannitol/chloroaromatic compound transport system substrate-binding protein
VIEKEAAQNADVKKVWESYRDFRKQYAVWGEVGYLK